MSGLSLRDEYAFYERIAEQSLLQDPEAGLDEMFLATLDEPAPTSRKSTGPAVTEPVAPIRPYRHVIRPRVQVI
jgi:hypothetical protein